MLRKILVVDSFSKQAISKIEDIAKNQNFKLIYEPDIHPSNISKFLLKNCSGIIVKDNNIDEQTLINWRNKYLSSRLCIIKAGADPSNIDLKMALELQIPIINYPGANSNQISQYILEKIPFDNITKIVSFIGFGYVAEKISQILLERNYRVQAYSPKILEKNIDPRIRKSKNLNTALVNADIIIILCPLVTHSEATEINETLKIKSFHSSYRIVNKEVLQFTKNNINIICSSRPQIMDINHIQDLIHSKKIENLYLYISKMDKASINHLHPSFSDSFYENIKTCLSDNNAENESSVRDETIMVQELMNDLLKYLNEGILDNHLFNTNE